MRQDYHLSTGVITDYPLGFIMRFKGAALASVVLCLATVAAGASAAAAQSDPSLPAPRLTDFSYQTPLPAGSVEGIRGQVILPAGADAAGLTLDVTRTLAGTPTADFTVTTKSGGDFALADVPPNVAGTYVYDFSYPGGTTYGPASQQVSIPVVPSHPTLGLSGPDEAILGRQVHVTGRLFFTSDSGSPVVSGNAPSDTEVTVTRTGGGLAPVTVPSSDVVDDGFGFNDQPSAIGVYTYKASYAGSGDIASASASLNVNVQRVTALSIATSSSSLGYDGTVTVTAHLGTTQAKRVVLLFAQTVGSSATRTVAADTVNSQGNLTTSVRLGNSTTFTARFEGDTLDTPAAASTTVSVGVKVASALSARTYHEKATLKDAVTITPDKHGQCVELQVQRYYKKAWHTVTTTPCGHLNGKSQATLTLKLGATTGQYRVRIYYIHSASDKSNASTYGGWLDFQIVR